MAVRFLAIDGFNLIRRIYEARNVQSEEDFPAVVSATASSIRRALTAHSPTHGALVLEHHDKTWRHLLYPDYKANRSATPHLLIEGLDDFTKAAAEVGLATVSAPSYEADDVIATVAEVVAGHDGSVVVLSTDKIFLQLLKPGVVVVDHFTDTRFDQEYVERHYGVKVDQYVDYLALVGDQSNNIKGVPGIGKKTAQELLANFESLDVILESGESEDKRVQKVQNHVTMALRCKQLLTLKSDVQLDQNLKSLRIK